MSSSAFAQEANSALDQLVFVFRDQAASWTGPLSRIALQVFGTLLVIDWILTFGRLALEGGSLDEFSSQLIRKAIFAGFALLLLQNPTILFQLVQGFRDSAAIATGNGSIEPSNVFDTALRVVLSIWQAFSIWDSASYALALAGFVILVSFGVASAYLIVTLIEMYIVIFGGVIVLGFLGSVYTKDYALRFIGYAFSVGMKLFVIQILMALSINTVLDLSERLETTNNQILVIVGVGVVMMVLVAQIPSLIQAFIAGVSGSDGLAGLKTAAAIGAIASRGTSASAGATAGSAMSIGEATKLGSESPGRGGKIGTAIGNLARAGKNDIAGRMSGSVDKRAGNMPGRMAGSMRAQRLGSSPIESMASTASSSKSTKTNGPTAGASPTSDDSQYVFGGGPDSNSGANAETVYSRSSDPENSKSTKAPSSRTHGSKRTSQNSRVTKPSRARVPLSRKR